MVWLAEDMEDARPWRSDLTMASVGKGCWRWSVSATKPGDRDGGLTSHPCSFCKLPTLINHSTQSDSTKNFLASSGRSSSLKMNLRSVEIRAWLVSVWSSGMATTAAARSSGVKAGGGSVTSGSGLAWSSGTVSCELEGQR